MRLPDPNADKAAQQHGKSLEALLAAKNKRILEELTKFRVRLYLGHVDIVAYCLNVDNARGARGVAEGSTR